MLESIKRFFENLAPEATQTVEEKQHAIHLAVSVLLVEMSRMDGKVSGIEIDQLHQLLEKQFQLSAQEKKDLTDLASQELDNSTDYYQFTSVINEHFEHQQKIDLIEYLWQIAFVDGKLDAHEEHYLRKIHSLLHVSHKDFMKTKHLAGKKINRP